MRTIPIKKVNLLYLISMLLVISLGTWMQTLSFSMGLIFTELLCILFPAWLLISREKINIRESVRIHKVRGSILLIAFLLGMGSWFVSSMIEILMVQISGYQVPVAAGVIPTGVFQAALIFLGLAVAAPLCEEFMFRGMIQSAYEKHFSPFPAILLASLLFAFFHLRLQGLPGLIPVGLILGFTYWRTRSLLASIVVHFANNLFASIVMIQAGLFPAVQLPFPSIQAALIGILVLVAGIVLLIRFTQTPQADRTEPVLPKLRWQVFWPILVAFILYGVYAGIEIASSKPLAYLPLSSQEMPASGVFHYELRHKGGESVGEATCRLSMQAEEIVLDCQRYNRDFEIQIGNNYFKSLTGSTEFQGRWRKEDLALTYLEQKNQATDFSDHWWVEPAQDQLHMTVIDFLGNEESLEFSPMTLVEEEWPFRLMGLYFDTQNVWITSYLRPMAWRQETHDSGPQMKDNFVIRSQKETIAVPAGEFETWKVQLMDGQAAWYTVSAPHIPVKIEANLLNYYLLAYD